jgi:UDP-glucose 4-epimerase
MAFHRFIKAAIAGDPVDVYGTGQQTRDFTFISDAVAANLAAAAYAGNATVFNIGGGSRASLNTVIDLIGRVTGRTLDVRYREPQPGDVTHTYADHLAGRARARLRPGGSVSRRASAARWNGWDAQRRGVESERVKISVVIPCYNEQESLPELFEKLKPRFAR